MEFKKKRSKKTGSMKKRI